jgi:HK97 family phage portal protein
LGFIQRIRNIFNLSLADPKAWYPSLWNLYGAQSASGENVNEETALTYSAFWNAVLLISGTISSLPCHLMRQNGKNREIMQNVPLYRVMHDKWNPYMSAKTGRQTITAHTLTHGNGYAEKVYNDLGEIVELWPIAPDRIKKLFFYEKELIYEIFVDGETKYLPKDRILHLHGLGFDGFSGYSVVSMARKSLGLGMAMETFGSRFFSQGINPSGVITHEGKVKDVKALREALTAVYAGLGNTHRLMLLEDGMKFNSIGIPPEDSQFIESRQFQIPEVARWFNLPPHKLKDLSKSSFNNIEQEQISFVTDSILPWLIDFEQEYNMQLLNDRQRYKEKLYFKHIVEGLLRADAKSRAEFYAIMKRNGFMTINEIREKEDLNPHDSPLADALWTEMNLVPIENYSTQADADELKKIEQQEGPKKIEKKQEQKLLLIKQGD